MTCQHTILKTTEYVMRNFPTIMEVWLLVFVISLDVNSKRHWNWHKIWKKSFSDISIPVNMIYYWTFRDAIYNIKLLMRSDKWGWIELLTPMTPSNGSGVSSLHDYVMTWECFPHYWSFTVRSFPWNLRLDIHTSHKLCNIFKIPICIYNIRKTNIKAHSIDFVFKIWRLWIFT